MEAVGLAKLALFRVGRFEHDSVCRYDFTDRPRPQSCMALILEGGGTFCAQGEEVRVSRGDIIFIPVTTRYASEWRGAPKTAYITIFFSFESPALFFRQKSYYMQKVALPDFCAAKERFEGALNGYLSGSGEGMLAALGMFYSLAADVFPKLKAREMKPVDERIERAVGYLDACCEKKVSVAELAHGSNMSVSYFYSRFRETVGMTPIEYKNQACVKKAIPLLMSGKVSIEEISDMLGFYSSGYFRRVFRAVTGKSPRDYRKTFAEL